MTSNQNKSMQTSDQSTEGKTLSKQQASHRWMVRLVRLFGFFGIRQGGSKVRPPCACPPRIPRNRIVRPWRNLWSSVVWTIRYWTALRSLRWNACPRCNSDSPEFWECPCCHGYDRTTRGLPCEDRKLIWLQKWMTEDHYDSLPNVTTEARP